MVGKSASHTKADKRRFQDLQEVGCIACFLSGFGVEPSEIHHITAGGRRLGHQHTIPLCPWHHRGISVSGLPLSTLEALKGPSLARNKRAFVERFGSELELLEIVNKRLELIRRYA